MLQLVQFRKQAMASLCLGLLFLCATPYMNTKIFRDPSGMFECQITLALTVECQYEDLQGEIECGDYDWCIKKLNVYQLRAFVNLSILIGMITSIIFWLEQGCLLNCLADCCLRYYYWFKPLLLTLDGLVLLYVAEKSSDIGNYDIMNYVLYPILIYVAAIAYLYPAVLFYMQLKMEKKALNEYFELS